MPDGADEKTFPVPARADMMRVNLPIMESDATLLDRYATQRDESAFRLLVERHAGMVLGVARRRTQDAALGEEAGQIVFTLLARKAAALRHLPPDKLGGWLHRTALLTAGNLIRSEMRRRIHHQRFVSENIHGADGPDDSSWANALPMVDEAIDSLPEADRQLVVQHFYQRRTFRELSTGTGRTEDAVRKRTGRALERLSAFFKRRGVALSAGALMSGLSARVTEAAPAGYAATATAAAVSKASSLSVLTVLSNTLATMALTKLTVTAAAVAFVIPLGLYWSGRATPPPSSPPETASALKDTKKTNSIAARSGNGAAVSSAVSSAAPPSSRSAALARFAEELAKVTPPPADGQRLAELQRLAFALPESELPLALPLLSGTTAGDSLQPIVRALAARWAEFDPEGALRSMTSSLGRKLEASVWSGALGVWGRRDFNAAFAWTCKQPDGDIVEQFGRAMKLADEGHTGEERGPAMLANIKDETLRQRYLYGLCQGYIHDGHDRDYRKALNLTAQLTDEEQRLEMIKSFGGSWAEADAPSASEWLATLPAGAERDAAISSFVTGAFATDPAAALTWSASIADEGKRTRRLNELYPKWLQADAAAAAAWLSRQTQLTATDRNALENGTPIP